MLEFVTTISTLDETVKQQNLENKNGKRKKTKLWTFQAKNKENCTADNLDKAKKKKNYKKETESILIVAQNNAPSWRLVCFGFMAYQPL